MEVTFEMFALCLMYFGYGMATAFVGMWVWKMGNKKKGKKKKG